MRDTIAGKPSVDNHPGDGLFEAVRAGLTYNNAHEDEYLEADLARDPCFLEKKDAIDPAIHGRIKKAIANHEEKATK